MRKENWSSSISEFIRTSPWLWIILLLAALIRIRFIVQWHTNAVALIFSLALVVLTWFFAAMLADGAHLSARAKERFMVMASLVMAAPPLYAIIQELNFVSSATLVIVLLLILYAYVIGRRWIENYSNERSMSQYIFTQFFRLSSIAVLFGICASFIGYYTQALVLVLPFVLAAIFTIPYMAGQYRDEVLRPRKKKKATETKVHVGYRVLHVFMLILIGLYFAAHLYTYVTGSTILPI